MKDTQYGDSIIAAVLAPDKLESALQSSCKTIFLLTGNLFNLQDYIDAVHRANKKVHIGIDLLEGFGKDAVFLEYVSKVLKPDGVITTKANLIKMAKRLDLFTIQRVFMFDSRSLSSGIDSVMNIKPDAVEILPGVMPKVIQKVHEATRVPIICGGLLADVEDIDSALKAGAIAVSTSNPSLWELC